MESLQIKKDIFRQLDDIVKPDAILATNTSSLSVTEISTANSSPGRVVGVHFFNPAPVQNLVKIIRTVVTEPHVLEDVKVLVGRLGKNPVICGDKAGFIANTLLFGYLNHAVSFFEGRYASREDIDAAMWFGFGYPMGPLALLDLIGLDTAYEDPRHDVQAGPRPPARSGSAPQADGHRRHAGPEVRSRLLRLRGAGQSHRGARPPHSRHGDGASTASRHRAGRRGGHRHDGSGHRRGVRQGWVRRALRRPFRQDKVDGVRATIEHYIDLAIQRGKLEESVKADAVGRLTGTTSLDDLSSVDIAVEAIAEDLKIKTTLFENLDEICKPGAILGDHDVVVADHLVGDGHQAAAGRHRHALLQSRARHEAGRGGDHCRDR